MIEKYSNWLLVNGASNSTTENYVYRIKTFLKQVKLEDISEETISNFLLRLKEKELSNSTINGYRDCIKSFLTFLKRDINIPKHLKIDKKIPNSITLEYFEKNVIPVVECIFKNPLKVKTILYFMFYTGVRKSEVYLLKRENLDLDKRIAKVYLKKTKTEKLMLFPKKVKNLLETYFSVEPETKYAFNIGEKAIDYIFNTLRPHFKDIKLHPHLFKKSAITHLHKCGFSETEISKMVGISKSTLDWYLDVTVDKIQETYDKRIK